MKSFTQQITTTAWTEVLNGGSFLFFDCEKSTSVFFHMNESATAPAIDAERHPVRTWQEEWDFVGRGFDPGRQRLWVIGENDNTLVGVRG